MRCKLIIGLLLCMVAESVGAENPIPQDTPPMERFVSLDGAKRSRRAALEDICRQAGITLKLDVEALAAIGLRLEEQVSVAFTGEMLYVAVGRVIEEPDNPALYRELRGDTLLMTTFQAVQARTLRYLPEWLRPYHNKGLIARVDDDGNVTSLTCSDVMTDELLVRLKELPRLRELDLGVTKTLTEAGIAHLGKLPALEKLQLSSVNTEGAGLGDAALEAVSHAHSLTDLSIAECGTTDAGARHLERMPQLTRLSLYQEGRLTDAALASVAKLKQLKHLDLSSYVATASYGLMRFSPEGLGQLAVLDELEELQLVGQSPSADLLAFPRLTSLSVGAVDDAAAMSISRCRDLRYLGLIYSDITDVGLKQIAILPKLRRLSLSSTRITDEGVGHLKTLSHLEHVELRATGVGDETLRHLANLKSLTRLDLNGSGLPGSSPGRLFSPDGLRQLKGLPRLRFLSLTNFQLDGGSGVLAELTQLRVLSLMMTGISEAEVEALEEALPNVRVHAMTGGGFLRRSKGDRAGRVK